MYARHRRFILSLLVVGLFCPAGVSAQIRLRAGGWAGITTSRQLRDDGLSTDWDEGVALGAYLDTPTPVSFLFVRVELGYHGRGSKISDPKVDPAATSPSLVTSHYVGVQLHGQLRVKAGALGVFLFGGPSVEQLVKTGCTEEFCAALGDGTPIVWGVAGGGGVEVDLPAGVQAALEYRLEEGLSVAYRNDLAEARNRTRGIILSVGFPFREE
jgi:hypothetical protein